LSSEKAMVMSICFQVIVVQVIVEDQSDHVMPPINLKGIYADCQVKDGWSNRQSYFEIIFLVLFWKYYETKFPWTLRLKLYGRLIIKYLMPTEGMSNLKLIIYNSQFGMHIKFDNW